MKKSFFYLVLFALMFLFCADTFAQTVHTGTEAGATLKAAVKFQSLLEGNTQDDIILGNSDLSSSNGSNQSWSFPQTVRFYSSDGYTKINAVISSTTTHTFTSSISPINYIEIELQATGSTGSNPRQIYFKDVTVNGHAVKDDANNNFIFASTGANAKYNITEVDLSAGFDIQGVVTVNNPNNGDNPYMVIRVGYLASADEQAPVASNPLATPDYAEVGTDIVLTANIDDSNTGNSNINSAEYTLDEGANWYPMAASDGNFDSSDEDVTVTLSDLDCGTYDFCIRGYDSEGNMSNEVCDEFTLYELGSVSGIVDVGGNGAGGVAVALYDLDEDFNIVSQVATTQSAPDGIPGKYEFTGLLPDDYRIGIVTPLGFNADAETKDINVPICGNDKTVNFTLTAGSIVNQARGKGYWKNQFDYYIKLKGHAQETLSDLTSYLDLIVAHYVPAYDLFFTATMSIQYWSEILSYGGPDMRQKAMGELATLLFNFASQKISQLEVVTADGNDVSDVISEASIIVRDIPGPTYTLAEKNVLERAKDMCEYVNNQKTIPAGWVTDHNILYKTGASQNQPKQYALYSNYPNPFNPSTVISYAIPADGFVTLKVYDLLGREVASLVNEKKEQGIYSVNFDASSLSTGVYLYKLQVNNFTSVKKMILIK